MDFFKTKKLSNPIGSLKQFLEYAINGNIKKLKFLLSHDTKIFETKKLSDLSSNPTKNLKQFLEYAANGNIKKLKLLLNQGIPVNIIDPSDPEKNTALHLAVKNNKIKTAKLLLEHGAEIHTAKADKNGSSAIHLGAMNGHVEIVELLLDYNANINQSDKSGMTPLHLAVVTNHLPMIIFLILNGADVDKENNSGTTILQTAALKRNKAILKALIAYSSFNFCIPEKYINLLARMVGSSISNKSNLHEALEKMLEVKVLMLWENNQTKIKEKLQKNLVAEKDVSPYLNYSKYFLIQCVIQRVSNKISKNLDILLEKGAENPREKLEFNQQPFHNLLKRDPIKENIKDKVLDKKINLLKSEMRVHAEKLEFEEAARLLNEITQITKLAVNSESSTTSPINQEEQIEYGGILGQMKTSNKINSSENKIATLKNKLYQYAQKLEFKEAARLRDEIIKLEEDSLK